MSVSSLVSDLTFSGNGSTSTAYALTNLRYDASAWLTVTRIDADGLRTPLALGTDYTLGGTGSTGNGSITTVAAIPADEQLEVKRNTPFTSGVNSGAPAQAYPNSVDKQFDWVALALQDLGRDRDSTFSRALLVPPGETIPNLLAAAERAGTLLGFDDDGDPLLVDAPLLTDAAALDAAVAAAEAAAAAAQDLQDLKRYFIDCDSAFLPLLRAGVRGETVSCLWASDSTWASQSGIPKKFADWWAGEFPNFRVEYAVPNAGFDNLTTTVVQAASGRQCWHWYTGDIWGPATVHTSARDTPVGATTSPVRLRARWSFDAVNGSGWPTTTYNLGGWGSTNRTYLYITATGRLGLLFYNGTTLIDPGASTNTLPALTAGTEYRFRATLIADDGAGGKTVHYEYSTNDGVTWSSLSGGTPQTQATATLIGDPGGTWYYWIGGWGGNAVAGAKCYGFNVDLHDGTNFYPILPERIDWLLPGDGQTTLSPELEGSPTLFVDNLSSSGSGVTRPTHWLVGRGADYLWDNRHALIPDRGYSFCALSSSHNDVGASGNALATGLDTLKETVIGQLGVAPKFVIFTQNPESATYPYLGPAHQRRQPWLLAYAAASRDAAVDANLMITEETNYDQYIEPGGVHPVVPGGYALMTTKFNAAMNTLKDTLAS